MVEGDEQGWKISGLSIPMGHVEYRIRYFCRKVLDSIDYMSFDRLYEFRILLYVINHGTLAPFPFYFSFLSFPVLFFKFFVYFFPLSFLFYKSFSISYLSYFQTSELHLYPGFANPACDSLNTT